jgi:hypothetical protein
MTLDDRLAVAEELWCEVYEALESMVSDLDIVRRDDGDEVATVRETAHDVMRMFLVAKDAL